MLSSLKFYRITRTKSRFAGFFALVLLSGCTKAPSQDELIARAHTEPAVATSLARQRLASAELESALHFFQLAAGAGDSDALTHVLALRQRLHGRLNTALWLEQQWRDGTLLAETLSPAKRAELGLWGQDKPQVAAAVASAGCKLTLQPVASQQHGVLRWQQLRSEWQQDKQLSALPVCFAPLQLINSTALKCSEHSDSRISCQYQALQSLVSAGDFTQLVVIAGRGGASYNNGILQLPDNASLALLRHEFMHVLGFIDEYALTDSSAATVCQHGKYYPNLVLQGEIETYLQHWQLSAAPQLTAVDTCQAAGVQAYRLIAEDNLMRFYELDLPAEYFALAQQVLSKPERLMPVQYYFAHLARQQQDWPLWQQFMQQAAEWGYPEASKALAP